MAPLRPHALALAAALAAAAGAFWPGVDGAFQWDDVNAVQGNARAADPSALLAGTGPLDLLGPARPVADLWIGAVRALGGPGPRPLHLASLLLHLGVALLVAALAREVLRRLDHPRAGPVAAAAAALFAVHPLQVESVSYASQASEVLAAALGLLSVLLLLRAEARWRGARAAAAAAGAAALLLLALGAKAVAVAVPAAFLLVALGARPAAAPGRARRALLLAAPSLLVAAAAVARNLLALGAEAAPSAGLGAGVGPWRYLLSQARVHWLYLRLAAFPVGLSVDHGVAPSPGLGDPATLAGAAALLALLAGAAWLWWRAARLAPEAGAAARAAALGLGWWFLCLAPTSSVIPIDDLAAEHRTYLALAGLALAAAACAAAGLEAALARWLPARRSAAGLALGAAAVAALALGTAGRAAQWRTPLALWADAAARNPGGARAASNHALALAQAGRAEAAAAEYARALALPASPEHRAAVAVNASALALDRGDLAGAAAIAGVGVAAAPWRSEPLAHRSLALGALGQREASLADALEGVRLEPGKPQARYALAVALWRLGRQEEARAAFAEALRPGAGPRLDPRAAFMALATLGRREEACAAFGALAAAGPVAPGLGRTAAGLGCPAR